MARTMTQKGKSRTKECLQEAQEGHQVVVQTVTEEGMVMNHQIVKMMKMAAVTLAHR